MFPSQRYKSGKMTINIKPLTDSGEDKLTGLQDIELSVISLFIDSATRGRPSCFPDCDGADLRGLDISGRNLYSNFAMADMSPKRGPIDLEPIKTNLTGTDLTGTDLTDAQLERANLTRATSDPKMTWPSADNFYDTTCPDGTNSDNNPSCGF